MNKVYLIGNAHLDPVWLWRWQEGFAEILATYRSALDRMKDFPDFKFTAACATYYEWIEKTDPEMFKEIQQRVKEGRWDIVGGMLIQPDCNIPCGESFARHLLTGQRYFKEKFGIIAKTGYNVDSFGHNASLPKILQRAGIENYVFMRPCPDEKKEFVPSLFNWESSDGSQVTTFRIPQRYCIISSCLNIIEEIKEMAEKDGCDYMAFYGVGNHGGGPTIKLIDEIHNLDIEGLVFSTPDEYFDNVKNSKLVTIADELQHHARGCYSAESSVKAKNRRCEQNLLAAERLCLMASKITGYKYPKEKLYKAWKNLLFNHFHDIMGGCAIKSAYTDADYLYGEIMSITEQEINKALTAISLNIDTLKGEKLPSFKDAGLGWALWEHEKLGSPIVVFNPHPWEVTAPVEVYASLKKVTDSNGKELALQITRGEMINFGASFLTVFNATIPAYGYEVFRLYTNADSEIQFEKTLYASEHYLENDKIKVEFSAETGGICNFYDKENNKHIIDKPCSIVLLDETACDTWAHDTETLGEVCGIFSKPEFKVIEEGNIKATLRITTRCGESVIQNDYTIIPGSNVVTVKSKINIREKHRTLKFAFPTTGDKVLSQIPYGTFEREFGTGEEPCGMWIASGNLCVANDSKYGYDTHNDEMRMTILRTAVYADHFGQQKRDDFAEYMDMDTHEFTYSVFPFKSKTDAEKKASELNFGLRYVMGAFHEGKLPEKAGFIKVKNENVLISAIKQHEDSEDAVIRLYEIEGTDTHSEIELFGKTIETEIKHNAIKTLLIGSDKITETDLIENI